MLGKREVMESSYDRNTSPWVSRHQHPILNSWESPFSTAANSSAPPSACSGLAFKGKTLNSTAVLWESEMWNTSCRANAALQIYSSVVPSLCKAWLSRWGTEWFQPGLWMQKGNVAELKQGHLPLPEWSKYSLFNHNPGFICAVNSRHWKNIWTVAGAQQTAPLPGFATVSFMFRVRIGRSFSACSKSRCYALQTESCVALRLMEKVGSLAFGSKTLLGSTMQVLESTEQCLESSL